MSEQNGNPDWVQLMQGGDKAFELLFKENYQSLCRFAYFLVKDRDEAEDIVQQVFYILYSKKDKLEINTTVRSYLFSSVRNACLNALRHQKVQRQHASEQAYESETIHATGETIIGNELAQKIEYALSQLPEQCGLVFRMSRFGNMKYKEIADELQISVKTVENHMGKALKLMRENLQEYLTALLILTLTIL